jgi:predicted transposase YbfD/YdcC
VKIVFFLAKERGEDKSNEITAIPQVLNGIDIEDTVVSIDAMGTQKETAELSVEKKGHYLAGFENKPKVIV